MRFLLKLVLKFVMFVVMVLVMGAALRFGRPYIMKAAGIPVVEMETPKFSSEEADLMSTVFQSALRLFSGTASRNELAGQLSDKLYSGRAGAGDMKELGIELVKPGESPSPVPGSNVANTNAQPPAATGPSPTTGGVVLANASSGKVGSVGKPNVAHSDTAATSSSPIEVRTALLAQLWERAKVYNVELTLVPIVLFAMVVVQRVRRKSRDPSFLPEDLGIQTPTDSEPYDMKHAVHALKSEDFELLVALIYQRQGYRVSMPAGQSGGRGGDFTLLRKAERILVQCKKLSQDHKVPVERIRELHEAATAAGATRSLYVASCGFSWDARHFAKTKNMTLINARTLDELLTAARAKPDEDLLAVSSWVSKLMSKVELTTPTCPACEADMDQIKVSENSVWVCSQRPECRGRRSARHHQKPAPAAPRQKTDPKDGVPA